MQKWLPEPFEASGAIRATGMVDPAAFQAEARPTGGASPEAARTFRSEAGFADARQLLNHLTQRERAQLFDLVEQDVARDYEQREKELRAGLEAQTAAAQENHRLALESLAGEMERVLGAQLKEIAEGSARLAIRLAEKVVRAAVAVDREILARALETAHYKLLDGNFLSVSLHPEDAEWLKAHSGLCERLKIGAINPDRRLERGGCLVKSGLQEVDATIARQLETLAEIVEEALATAGQPDRLLGGKDAHEPEVG